MLNTLLSGAISRLRAASDDRVHLDEMGDWSGLTGREVAKLLRKAGLKSKPVRKLGKVAKGYMRLDLLELQDRLEREAKGQSEAPLRDWFCVECGEMFEARKQECPRGDSHAVHAVLNKAPGTLGVRTKNKDDVLRNLVDSSGMTDYTNARDMSSKAQASMWASPGGGYNMGEALRNIYPSMRNMPDMPVTMPSMPGKATVAPSGATFSPTDAPMIEKAKVRRPTFVEPQFRDRSPLPSVP